MLRRKLLSEIEGNPRALFAYRVSFAASLLVTLSLAAFVGFLVIQPTYAQKIHDYFGFNDSSIRMAKVDSENDGIMTDAMTEIVLSPMELDREFVHSWAEETFSAQPVSVKPIDITSIFTMNRFRLNDGKIVEVLTQIPDRAPVRPVKF